MTIKQKQCLLAYLGYYEGGIDGKWGSLSEEATVRFQRDYGLDDDGIFGKQTKAKILEVVGSGVTAPKTGEKPESGDFWNEIEYFTREEFRCKCGGKFCDGFSAEPEEKLIRTADRVRGYFGKRATVSSGVRCQAHNANVGGVANSRHLSGKAMDFCVDGFSAVMVLAYVLQQKDIRYAYAIDGNYVHMDVE